MSARDVEIYSDSRLVIYQSPLMATGEGSLFIGRHDRHPGFWSLLRPLSNILPSLVALGDLLIPGTARWCAPYPCGMCNTNFDSFKMGHPPSCSAT